MSGARFRCNYVIYFNYKYLDFVYAFTLYILSRKLSNGNSTCNFPKAVKIFIELVVLKTTVEDPGASDLGHKGIFNF